MTLIREKMQEERKSGVESAARSNTVEQNLTLWNRDEEPERERGQQCCLRAKIDMSAKNKALRDPVIYRVNSDCASSYRNGIQSCIRRTTSHVPLLTVSKE